MKSLTIRQRQVRGVVIIDLEGQITLGETNRQLHEAIKQAVAEGKRDVILNLAKVMKIDSSGLGEIVAGFTTLNDNGGVLKLANLPDSVADLMMMTKLLTVFEVYDDERNAVDSFEDDKDRHTDADVPDSKGPMTREVPDHMQADATAGAPVREMRRT